MICFRFFDFPEVNFVHLRLNPRNLNHSLYSTECRQVLAYKENLELFRNESLRSQP